MAGIQIACAISLVQRVDIVGQGERGGEQESRSRVKAGTKHVVNINFAPCGDARVTGDAGDGGNYAKLNKQRGCKQTRIHQPRARERERDERASEALQSSCNRSQLKLVSFSEPFYIFLSFYSARFRLTCDSLGSSLSSA